MHLIAHLSDPHLDGTAEARDRFLAVVAHLRGLPTPVDAIAVTGDLVQGDAHDEYDTIADALADGPPAIVCPGNTDTRTELRSRFPGAAGVDAADGSPVDAVLDLDGVRVVLLDSLVEGSVHGELRDESVRFLTDRLGERPGTPTLVGWHHFPVALGHPGIDGVGLREPGAVAEVVAGAGDVAATIVGHAHGAITSTFAGRPMVIAPGIRSQLIAPFEVTHEGPPFFDTTRPPGFAVHAIDDDGRVTTYVRILADGSRST